MSGAGLLLTSTVARDEEDGMHGFWWQEHMQHLVISGTALTCSCFVLVLSFLGVFLSAVFFVCFVSSVHCEFSHDSFIILSLILLFPHFHRLKRKRIVPLPSLFIRKDTVHTHTQSL